MTSLTLRSTYPARPCQAFPNPRFSALTEAQYSELNLEETVVTNEPSSQNRNISVEIYYSRRLLDIGPCPAPSPNPPQPAHASCCNNAQWLIFLNHNLSWFRMFQHRGKGTRIHSLTGRVSALSLGTRRKASILELISPQYCIEPRRNIGTPLEIGCIHAYTGATNDSVHVSISLSFVAPDCPLSAVEKTTNWSLAFYTLYLLFHYTINNKEKNLTVNGVLGFNLWLLISL
jgi:hypothetical protein